MTLVPKDKKGPGGLDHVDNDMLLQDLHSE